MRASTVAAVVLLATLLGATTSARRWSVDPLPKEYTVLSTQGEVRILRFAGAPGGAMGPMHTHPPHFAYVEKGGTVRFSYPDGRTIDAPLRAGQTLEIARPITHAVQVIGPDSVTLLLVEPGPANAGKDGAQPDKQR